MRQLNVTDTDYNHIICLQLLASKAICDVCTGGDCIGTCSASTGITTVSVMLDNGPSQCLVYLTHLNTAGMHM